LSKAPRFFCDNCGQEVGDDLKTCPFCGRYFASVRCPKCGFHGEDSLFVNGCPSCGYSADGPAGKAGGKKRKRKRKKAQRLPAEPLPASAYVILTAALFVFIAFVSWLITR